MPASCRCLLPLFLFNASCRSKGVLRTALLPLLLHLCSHAFATEKPSKAFHHLSCPEKRWVIFHPFIAKKAYRLTQQAKAVAKEMAKDSLLDGDENGGQVDA